MAGRLADQGYGSAITTDLTGTPDPDADGFCCPQGTRAIEQADGTVACEGFEECYVESVDSRCDYNFSDISDRYFDWFDAEYSGDPSDFCVSAKPEYFHEPEGQPIQEDRSTACCRVEKHGGGFYFDDESIQVFG